MTVEHPTSANLYLNYGFAYVDKIPIAGSITQVILANNALTQFSKSIELQPSWIAYYTRGASYLFWPKIFNRAAFGVADLEKALDLQKTGPQRSYYVRTYISLGDGYWKTDEAGMERIKKAERLLPGRSYPGYMRRITDFPAFPLGNVWADTLGQNQFGGLGPQRR